MDFLNKLNNCILITPSNLKTKVLEYINSIDRLINIKIISFTDLKKELLFDYDDNTILYLVDKYNYNIDVAKELIDNIYYIENKTYKSDKLNKLVLLKKELEDNNLLIKNDISIDKNTDVYVFGYDYINKFNNKLLSYYNNVKVIDKNIKKNNNKVYKLNTLEDELLFVIDKIIELLNSNVPINKINLVNINDDYNGYIIKYFKMFNIPVNISNNTSLISTIIGKEIINHLEETKDINGTLEYLNNKYIIDTDLKQNIYNSIFNIFNKYSYLEYDINTKIIAIKDDFSKKKISKEVIGINITSIKDNYFFDDEYVFFLNLSEGVVPIIHSDEDYITDNLKGELGLDTTKELNVKEKESLLKNINSINNITMSYKENYNGDKYYLSNIANNFEILSYDRNMLVSYSNLYSKIRLGSLIDDLIKYDTKSNELNILYNNISIPYREFNNDYKTVDKKLIKDKINKLSLSYTTLNTYNLCSFRYYLDNVLKVNSFTSSFDTLVGELFHFILSKSYEDNFDFETEYINFLKDKELTTKDKFYLNKLKKELELVLEYLKEFNNNTGLTNTLREKKIEIDHDNYIFKGIIDKIMYKDYDGQTLVSIIDYKTGSASFDINNSYYGLDMQLPIYLYLLKESKLFPNYKVVGLYLERILNSEVNIDKSKTYKEIKFDNLKLNGISTDDTLSLERFDPTYVDSNYIKSMKYGNNGFYKYCKVLTDEEFDSLTKLTEKRIEEAVNNIYDSNFSINPKKFDIDKEVTGCAFCKYKDICFRKNEDIVEIEKLKDLSFLKEGDNNA